MASEKDPNLTNTCVPESAEGTPFHSSLRWMQRPAIRNATGNCFLRINQLLQWLYALQAAPGMLQCAQVSLPCAIRFSKASAAVQPVTNAAAASSQSTSSRRAIATKIGPVLRKR